MRVDGGLEVLVIESGPSKASAWACEFPTITFIRSERSLSPAESRNRGVLLAKGEYIAFCPDDGVPVDGWLTDRLEVHQQGYLAVGGSITNGRPDNYVASAEYLLEYSALLPHLELLRAQDVPHALSFHRTVFDQLGLYPTDTSTGEDTLFNRRVIERGLTIGFAPSASIAHVGNATVSALCQHAMAHGRGLAECTDRHGLQSVIGESDTGGMERLARGVLLYPAVGLVAKFDRLRRYAPRVLPAFVKALPLILLGQLATGLGAWAGARVDP